MISHTHLPLESSCFLRFETTLWLAFFWVLDQVLWWVCLHGDICRKLRLWFACLWAEAMGNLFTRSDPKWVSFVVQMQKSISVSRAFFLLGQFGTSSEQMSFTQEVVLPGEFVAMVMPLKFGCIGCWMVFNDFHIVMKMGWYLLQDQVTYVGHARLIRCFCKSQCLLHTWCIAGGRYLTSSRKFTFVF